LLFLGPPDKAFKGVYEDLASRKNMVMGMSAMMGFYCLYQRRGSAWIAILLKKKVKRYIPQKKVKR